MHCTKLSLIASSCVVLAAGCATAPPPRELVDARAAFAHAQEGPAATYAPVPLHEATLALADAEHAYDTAPRADSTRDIAYIAERRAQLADVAGHTAAYQRSAQAASAERETLLTQLHSADRQTLSQTETALSDAQQRAAAANASLQTARAALASLQQMANVREEQRGLVITLSGSVLFPTGESTLLPIAQQRLDEVAQALATMGDREVVVEGHTDSRGAAGTNDRLSEMRAESVREYLVTHGVAPTHIRAVGYGSTRPVAENTTAEGRANNRRVEIVVAPAPH